MENNVPNDPTAETNDRQDANNTTPEEATVEIDESKLEQYLQALKLEQNLPKGILAGLVAALVGAGVWAVISVLTKYQIGWMAVGVGFLVGYAVRIGGKGMDKIFGIVGAFFALLGCLLGNVLTLIGFVAEYAELSYFETLSLLDWTLLPEMMKETFDPIDVLFYGLALYEGYRFSIRRITQDEVLEHAGKRVES